MSSNWAIFFLPSLSLGSVPFQPTELIPRVRISLSPQTEECFLLLVALEVGSMDKSPCLSLHDLLSLSS